MSGALALRRGTVASVEREGPATELTVEVGGERRRAVAYTGLTGPVEAGDDVVVNVAAADLRLGSGGFDIVHANLTRGLDASGEPGAHVMKLNYTPLQHAVHPVEERAPGLEVLPLEKPVAVIALHGQLPCVVWAARGSGRIGYVQTPGGALPGAHSRVVAEMLDSGMLAGHITAGPSFGGRDEAISVAGALHAGLTELGWDAAIAGPGPGILGSATALGHGGLAALDTAHAALSLGCSTVLVPRMSEGDPRERHRGISHHTETVLRLVLRPVILAMPEGFAYEGEHRTGAADVEGYRASGLPARTMGRDIADDELFFRSALAGGSVLAEEIHGV